MAYVAWNVTFGEQPSAAKWNILGTNDASFNDGSGIGNDAITTAKVIDDAITDPKLIYGKVKNRQGGSATSWGASGANTYDVSASNVIIQCGTKGTDSAGDITITFPTAYTYTPVFVCSVSGGNAGDSAVTANCFAEAVQVSPTTAIIRTFNTGGGQSNQAVGWIAMGV